MGQALSALTQQHRPWPRIQSIPAAEVRSGDVHEPLQLATGDRVTFTIVEGADGSDNRVSGGWLLL